MASALLRWMWAAPVMVTGCVVPLTYPVLDDPVNHSPAIDTDKVLVEGSDAPQDGVYTWDVAINAEFALTLARVTEADTQDDLFVRWFVGHDSSTPSLNVFRAEDQLSASGATDRRAPRFVITPALLDDVDRGRAAAGQPVQGRSYLVEVYVGDRRPVFGAGPTTFPPEAGVAHWQWVLRRVNTGGGG